MLQRHATDVVSLVFGVVFAGLTVVWALTEADRVHGSHAWWIGPAVLIIAGGAGLAAALRASRPSGSDRSPAAPPPGPSRRS